MTKGVRHLDPAELSVHLEAGMVILFGISWPLSIIKSLKARTAKGKSLLFMSFILIGYLSGIASKLFSGNIQYNFWFYILNAIMVSIDLALYFRNKKLDEARAEI